MQVYTKNKNKETFKRKQLGKASEISIGGGVSKRLSGGFWETCPLALYQASTLEQKCQGWSFSYKGAEGRHKLSIKAGLASLNRPDIFQLLRGLPGCCTVHLHSTTTEGYAATGQFSKH